MTSDFCNRFIIEPVTPAIPPVTPALGGGGGTYIPLGSLASREMWQHWMIPKASMTVSIAVPP